MSDTLTELHSLRGQMHALDRAKAEVAAKYKDAQARLHDEMKASLVEKFGPTYQGRITIYENLDPKQLPDFDVQITQRS